MFPTFTLRGPSSGRASNLWVPSWKILWLGLGWIIATGGGAVQGADVGVTIGVKLGGKVTQAAQFLAIPREAFLGECNFQLEGTLTLVDPHRNLLVLQDETGAVALHPRAGVTNLGVQAGQRVLLEGSQCAPYFAGFPNFPYRPSGRGVQPTFEAPSAWGNYYLTRMRGYVRPPVSGDYTFWIASDNSSELWLSANDDPARVKKIALISRYAWVAPREWSRYASQRSESIHLKAGQSYYLEAFQEQTSGGDHLAVAWQGGGLEQAIIAPPYLSPWGATAADPTNGVLREYWTNFSIGGLAAVTGPRAFESLLSVAELRVTPRGEGAWPKPRSISLDQPLRPEDNFRWVEVAGNVTFAGWDGAVGFLELSDGAAQVQVRVSDCDPDWLQRLHNSSVRVEGVCERGHNQKWAWAPGVIWAAKPDRISLIETARTNLTTVDQSAKLAATANNPAMIGFYSTRGVVTFNDRVFGQEYMFVQEETAAMFVSLKDRAFGNQFEVGRWVELGGNLQPGKNIPVLNPMVVTEFGWRAMPTPLSHATPLTAAGSRDGRWTEAAGVVHAVNSNGTFTLMSDQGPLAVWVGKTSADALRKQVDAKLRLRGVLSLTIQDEPLLLVPAPSFVDVEREAPADPFAAPLRSVANLFASELEAAAAHRVKLVGHVTFSDETMFFMQDASGGVRVQPTENHTLEIGRAVEVVGFPRGNGSMWTLTEALVHPGDGIREVPPQKLDAREGISFKHAGALVQVSAKLITQWSRDGRQILELQEAQRMFEAELPPGQKPLPQFAPGSRLQLTGVCDFAPATGANLESPSTGALKIRLRRPADVVRLSGPPWWSWKHTAVLVGTLLTVLVVSLLRLHLLRRRLEQQLAFSRQILESQESERHRIAANLHDSLGQNLLVIKNQARLAMQPAGDESVLRQRLDEISGCASQAITEVREITHALRPYHLDRLGLTQAIRATVSRAAANSSIVFASHADDIDGLFDKESEIHVYRIVQEAVNNILKHSAATEATVVVKKQIATISLSIRDNGRGFDAAALHHSNSPDVGHGISGINERARILGGNLVIDSRPGAGTVLSIEIPIRVPLHEVT